MNEPHHIHDVAKIDACATSMDDGTIMLVNGDYVAYGEPTDVKLALIHWLQDVTQIITDQQ